jgi:hypothetical protein
MSNAPADLPVSLVFARNQQLAEAADVPRPSLVITPAPYNSWNDFGHNFEVGAYLLLADSVRARVNLDMMFEEGGRTSRRLEDLLSDGLGWSLSTAFPFVFCSLLRTTQAYGDLVASLGFELAVSVLRAAGDAVVVRLENQDVARLSLINSVAFHLGMLRSNESYTTFRRGARYLRRTPAPEVDDAAKSFALLTKLPCAPNRYVVAFDFDDDPLGGIVTVIQAGVLAGSGAGWVDASLAQSPLSSSFPGRDHQPCRLAVSRLQPDLSGRRTDPGGARRDRLL